MILINIKFRRSFALIFSKNYQCFEKLYQTLETDIQTLGSWLKKLGLVFGYLMKHSSSCLIYYMKYVYLNCELKGMYT